MIDLNKYGYHGDRNLDDGLLPARIIAVHKERYEIICPHGYAFARLKAKSYYSGDEPFPTVGDFAALQYNPSGDSLIARTLERTTFFSRVDPATNKTQQAVAANFDYVLILSSLNQDFNLRRIERYLTQAWQSGGFPLVTLTKADLCDGAEQLTAQVESVAPGVPVIAVSSVTGQGLERLAEYLTAGKTAVLLGMSGVGKSSLLNALSGHNLMEVGDIREDDARGRHTTTHRHLFMLPSGAMVIDTPGMRSIGMWDVSAGLGEAFSDIESLTERCRFSDCSHRSEPGCAVQAALQSGDLSPARWENYLGLQKEARFAEDKQGYLRERDQWHKQISKTLRQQKKGK